MSIYELVDAIRGDLGMSIYELVDAIRGDLGMMLAVRTSLWMQSEATWE